ncbi:hypothetical protein, partial [Enterobacter bugandensis]|uniref:hypothetical protein n=1 Tax=Enterobacter bugandensis TaxID=881260 RepID=UPI001C9449F9
MCLKSTFLHHCYYSVIQSEGVFVGDTTGIREDALHQYPCHIADIILRSGCQKYSRLPRTELS